MDTIYEVIYEFVCFFFPAEIISLYDNEIVLACIFLTLLLIFLFIRGILKLFRVI